MTSRMLLLTLTLQLRAPFLLQPGLATCCSCWVNPCRAAPKHRGLGLARRHCHVWGARCCLRGPGTGSWCCCLLKLGSASQPSVRPHHQRCAGLAPGLPPCLVPFCPCPFCLALPEAVALPPNRSCHHPGKPRSFLSHGDTAPPGRSPEMREPKASEPCGGLKPDGGSGSCWICCHLPSVLLQSWVRSAGP